MNIGIHHVSLVTTFSLAAFPFPPTHKTILNVETGVINVI